MFFFSTAPEFELDNLRHNALPNGWSGVFAAIPFAIWFFLAIEGVANVAEETINPQKNILIGFGSAIFTLVILCVLTFTFSVGVNGWETVVVDPATNEASDSPLPLAMADAVGKHHIMFKLVSIIGFFGLIASFHGSMLVGGRASYELWRVNYWPPVLGKNSQKINMHGKALLRNMCIGIVAL